MSLRCLCLASAERSSSDIKNLLDFYSPYYASWRRISRETYAIHGKDLRFVSWETAAQAIQFEFIYLNCKSYSKL